MPSGIRLTEQDKNRIVDYYLIQPITIHETAQHFGYSDPTIIKVLQEKHIPTYKKAQVYNPNFNEHFFDVINHQNKAYFLGLLITDGNIFDYRDGNRQPAISITQRIEKEYVLHTFKALLKTNTCISHDGRGCAQLTVRSNHMTNTLAKYGIIPNKTLYSYLPMLHESLMPHLIRGILDGDGNITSTLSNNTHKHVHAISFCGTHKLMNDISTYVSKQLNIQHKHVYDYKDRHLSEVKWAKKSDMFRLGEWLYQDAEIFLTYKFDAFQNFKTYYKLS